MLNIKNISKLDPDPDPVGSGLWGQQDPDPDFNNRIRGPGSEIKWTGSATLLYIPGKIRVHQNKMASFLSFLKYINHNKNET